ncbi:MAG: 23S rRNA (uracil(1939)-C(5))-methyltransferase RlmD [Halobacteriovoraceae bacterium]|nr:23S rRNA (uracil(1939)-C(5))-methyltransferase RlmD [Halobacteriovoraceae bacterium]|tara:strand:+ start:10955 stop:12076 length:1122 start_codon:yes stop_codon:yes gene_type:complete
MKLNCRAYIEKRCQSCSLIELDYATGLEQKIEGLKSLFDESLFEPALAMDRLAGYRNKAKLVVGGDLSHPVLGIPSLKNSQMVTTLLDCPIHHPKLNEIVLCIQSKIFEFKLTPYSIAERRGEFKYLIINIAKKTGEISVRFGMRSLESFERVKKLTQLLQKNFSEIKVISFEVQPKHAAVFEGETYYLTDEKYIQHDFDEFKLLGSTTNFFQINSELAHTLYQKVYQRYQDEDFKLGVDLFCGVGGFAQVMSRFCDKVIGIEINENAIACAKESAAENIKFFCDDAFKFPEYNKNPIDLLVVNPPRRGLGNKFSELICKMAPKFLVYSSCNPQTLRADADILERDYELESIIPVDMFALTEHLEVLSFWRRK